MKKARVDIWEKIFVYPSFNIRFGYTLSFILFVFFLFIFIYFRLNLVSSASDIIASVNLFVQLATLILGGFAAYYALRQLVETRFTGLDQAAYQELKGSHFSRAVEKWREAFFIKPEASIFISMCEALILQGDYPTFDHYIETSSSKSFLKRKIIEEYSDKIILLYLKIIRNLLVKNQGEAEIHLTTLITFANKQELPALDWTFIDLQRSDIYQKLDGECRIISENLIAFLSKTMLPNRLQDFLSGKFATEVDEQASAAPVN